MDILLTGSNGFLGTEIHRFFAGEHHKVYTVVRNSKSDEPNGVINADLSTQIPALPQNIELVIHAAGKAHAVPRTQEEKDTFYTENLNISKHLIAALAKQIKKPKWFVFISSVAVYGLEAGHKINEDTALNATDAYGLSKIKSEQIITKWCKENNVVLTVLRLPLIAGVQPPGNLGDMMNAIKKHRFPLIAQGKARRSMVVAADIPAFIDKIKTVGGTYHLTDGHDPSFAELVAVLKNPEQSNVISLPLPFAKVLAFIGDFISKIIWKDFPFNSRKLSKMTNSLTFSNEKAVGAANWTPTPVLNYLKNSVA